MSYKLDSKSLQQDYIEATENLYLDIKMDNQKVMERFDESASMYRDELLVLRDGITLPDGRFVIDKQKQNDILLANKVLTNYLQQFDNNDVEVIRIEVSGPNDDRITALYGQKKNPNRKKVILPNGTIDYQ